MIWEYCIKGWESTSNPNDKKDRKIDNHGMQGFCSDGILE
jgi:hypothetical protein